MEGGWGYDVYLSIQETFTVLVEDGMWRSGGGLGSVRNWSDMLGFFQSSEQELISAKMCSNENVC